MADKIKVLFWADYCCGTGFANVAGNIWRELYATDKYDLDVIGINYSGDPYDHSKWPGNIWPAVSGINAGGKYADLYGRQKLLDMLGHGEYDILFMIQDTFIVQTMMEAILETQTKHHKKFKTVYYFPIDATPMAEWVKEVVSLIDYPVAYTNYAFNECIKIDPRLESKLKVIYHGNNFTDFYPIEDPISLAEFRHHAFRGETDGKFLITNVNRNQRRKDLPRSFMILKELRDRGIKDAILYLHASLFDVGGDLLAQANNFGLEINKDYLLPENLNPHSGFPVDVLNSVYNVSDCLLTTTHGEGWGFSISESLSTKTPVVAPNNTSLSEMLADNRGYLIKSGADPSMWVIKEQDMDRLRPLMDIEDAADKIELLMNGIYPDIEGAYEWVKNLDWANIAKQWEAVIEEAVTAPVMRYQSPKYKMAIPKGKKR